MDGEMAEVMDAIELDTLQPRLAMCAEEELRQQMAEVAAFIALDSRQPRQACPLSKNFFKTGSLSTRQSSADKALF
jgi:hypothetical protein